MIVGSGDWIHHWVMMQTIGHEILSIRNPSQLAERAGGAKEGHDAPAVRHPDRRRLHRLLRHGWACYF